MRAFFQKMDELFTEHMKLTEQEKRFAGSYLEDVARELRYEHHGREVDLGLEYHQANPKDFESFITYLLTKCITEDNYRFVSHVCSYCYGNLPNDQRIKELLEQGIWAKDKSNRLRERFFWVFNFTFKEDAKKFFLEQLKKFINENRGNPEIVFDIIDFAHWNVSPEMEKFEDIQVTVREFLYSLETEEWGIRQDTKEFFGL